MLLPSDSPHGKQLRGGWRSLQGLGGKRLCLGWTRQGQTRKKVVECLAFILNPVKPSKIKAKKEKKI